MPLSSRDKARLYHELGTMLASGFHLDRGLDLLLAQKPPAPRRRWLEGLRTGLRDRLGVAESLAKHNAGTVTDLEQGLIAAGERGGRLDAACKHLAEYFELRRQSTSRALGALIYPLILAHLGALFPDLSRAMVGGGLSGAFAGAPLRLLVLWALLAALGTIAVAWSRAAVRSSSADRLLRLMPLVGSIRGHWALARFAQVMRTGLLAAMRISETLRLAGAASQSALMDRAARVAADAIDAGGDFSGSLRAAGGFPAEFVNSMEMAEQSGTLDHELGRWAEAEVALAARAQDRAAEWLPRIFYVLVVLYVASRILGMFGAYYGQLGRMLEP